MAIVDSAGAPRAPERWPAWLVAAFMSASAASAGAATYTPIDLGTLAEGTMIVVRGPNVAGVAVGGGRPVIGGRQAPRREGLVFDRGATQNIPGLAGSDETNVLGINDLGAIVGAANGASAVRAFMGSRSETSRQLPPLPGDTASVAYAINNAARSVGYSSGPAGERAVAWSPGGEVTALAGTASIVSRAYGVNASGTAVGVVGSSTARRGTVWPSAGGSEILAPLQGFDASEAAAINARGDAVGFSTTAAENRRATLWPAGRPPVDLGILPGGTLSQASGINASGVIVGWSTSTTGQRACIWTSAGLQDLNAIASVPGIVFTKAVGVNDAGSIVALGVERHPDAQTEEHGHDHEQPVRVFLLVPSGG